MVDDANRPHELAGVWLMEDVTRLAHIHRHPALPTTLGAQHLRFHGVTDEEVLEDVETARAREPEDEAREAAPPESMRTPSPHMSAYPSPGSPMVETVDARSRSRLPPPILE